MTTALAERPTAPATTTEAALVAPPAPRTEVLPARPVAEQEIDRDGIEVYCPDAGGWSRTRHFFCESCGATDHDLR
ncbi:MAG TPA: hypothetical protein VKZ83_11005 [Phototrophicaceae bacterium]|nr:hypothetical protein [Phototrophicaceae bacterium]